MRRGGHWFTEDQRGVVAALLSPVFLGAAPVLGKLATNAGADPFTVAAMRTVIAVAVLWACYLVFWRKYIYIYPAALLGCVMVGVVNGVGSVFYYNGLARLDASVAQLLNGTYLLFVVILARLGGTILTMRTVVRVALALVAVMLLTVPGASGADWVGVGFMIANALLFAGHVIMGQRVLFEIPPQTFTLYVLSAMGVVVTLARAVYDIRWVPLAPPAVAAIGALAFTTLMSRLLLFIGVKQLGGLQTILLGVAEIALALGAAMLLLGESLLPVQWLGAAIMLGSMFLMRTDAETPTGVDPNAIALPNYAGMVFFQGAMAFNKAFLSGIPDAELQAIRKMVGPSAAGLFGVDTASEAGATSAPPDESEPMQPGAYAIGPHLSSGEPVSGVLDAAAKPAGASKEERSEAARWWGVRADRP